MLKLDLGCVVYVPLQGSSYLRLPKELVDKKAVLNIKSDDERCFVWSVLAALQPVHRKDHPENGYHYKKYVNELNLDGIEFPMKVSQIAKFERQNTAISVNVFGYEQKELFPVYITKEKKENHVNLLLPIANNETRHYCLIRNLNRLLSSLTRRKAQKYFCEYCLHGFIREDLLLDHEPHCSKHGPQKIKLPNEDNDVLYFMDVQKQLKVPFVIYADFESYLVKCDQQPLNPSISFTQKTQERKPSGFCYTVVSEVENYDTPPIVYRGEDAVDTFLDHLLREEKRIKGILKHVVRVRDHCHLTGRYRGAAHSDCNLNYKFSNRIPVVLHNLRGYDSHLIMQGLGKLKGVPIKCIPNNTEKYISFAVGDLVFIDSLQFRNASLEKLVSNLAKEGDVKFRLLKKYTATEKVPLLLTKGVYPYEYVSSFQKFQETNLPPKEAFFSTLRNEGISLEDCTHAQTVFTEFECQSLRDYHDLYLRSDVLLLADVFENFRDICLNYYKLDPAHFYTSPGLSWQACLRMTKIELELLTDPDMYLFIEEGLMGGISMFSNRYSKANNPYIVGYDKDQKTNYIMYLDAYNLYGHAISKPLPEGGLVWLNEEEIIELDLTNIADDGEEGYILEVDLEYPPHLHDLHSDYPLAPEKMKVTTDMLSPYCQQLASDLHLKPGSVSKLVPNLNDKTKYIVHYHNLKLYLSLGMRLTKVHRVLNFQQSSWLRKYIEFNTEKRKQAANDFEKDFFELLVNSVFGKTMENLRKRVNVKLVNDVKQLKKLTASPSFDHFRIFTNELVAVNMKKPTLYLNRPIYVGFAILDLSKVLMYDFHYNYIKAKYGEKATLLFTDTDSLCYNIQTEDIYRDMQEEADLFVDLFKDEVHGTPVQNS